MKPEDLTAWALNELSAEDRAQVEAHLQDSNELQARAQDTKAFCALLTEQLSGVDEALTTEQRQALLASVPGNVVTFDARATAGNPSVAGVYDPGDARLPTKPSAKKKLLRSGVKDPSYNWPLRIAGLAACAACAMFVIRQSGVLSTKQEVAFEPVGSVAYGDDEAGVHRVQSKRRTVAETAPKMFEPTPKTLASSSNNAISLPEVLELPKMASMQGGAGGSIDLSATRESEPTTAKSNSSYYQASADQNRARMLNMVSEKWEETVPPASNSPVPASTATAIARRSVTIPSATAPASPAPGKRPPSGSNSYTGGTSLAGTTPKEEAESTLGRGLRFGNAVIVPDSVDGLLRGDRGGDDARQIPQSRTSTERYTAIHENSFLTVASEPLSTFSIDVDTASYANVRRFLNQGSLPPPDAVRLEELINYFPYHYEAPAKDAVQPFSVQVDLAESPWTPEHRIARIGIKGKDIGLERVPANFVFLVDVSGSMSDENKLPLVKRSLLMLTEQLEDNDRVALVTYAGESGVALESTVGKERAKITAAIFAMNSGGSTNGASGIELAYAEAQKHFIKEGVNRVILCTDGDFNVGISSPEVLEKLIKQKAQGGVFLSVLGYGQGNLQDRTMETLADKGNGNYAYIDSLSEARKVLVEQMHGTLVTIAKDVKIQVEFNPSVVRAYRLLGYENRVLAAQDFNNDRKDAGEIGAGHTVTALYEIVTVDAPMPPDRPLVDDLKYQPKAGQKEPPAMASRSPLPKLEGINDELMTVKLRYKSPDGDLSKLIEVPVKDAKTKIQDTTKDFQFAAAVTGFGLLLRDSEHRGTLTWEQVRNLAIAGKGEDPLGYRGEFIQLIDKANGLGGRP